MDHYSSMDVDKGSCHWAHNAYPTFVSCTLGAGQHAPGLLLACSPPRFHGQILTASPVTDSDVTCSTAARQLGHLRTLAQNHLTNEGMVSSPPPQNALYYTAIISLADSRTPSGCRSGEYTQENAQAVNKTGKICTSDNISVLL